MAIFGLRSRKSTSSTASSYNKHVPDSVPPNRTSEAADAIGDTPEFGQISSHRRTGLNASDSSSLLSRNSSSMKKFFGSTRRKGAQSVDGGSPAQSHKNSPGSDYFNNANSKRASHTSLNKTTTATSSAPVITPSAIAPSLSSPAGPGGSFAEAVGRDVSGGLAPSPAVPAGPRPSELFAGKGVQWNQIDLTSRDITKPTDAASTTVDMQKFLKERRQWIPTFKDSDTVDETSIELPKSLDQFAFATPAEVSKSSAGLKSLKDLEDTHKRKAALLNEAPLSSSASGTIFEEAGPSSGSRYAADAAATAGSKSPTQALPPAPAQPSRNQSFRTSSFAAANDAASARKSNSLNRKPPPTLGVNGGGAAQSTSSRDIPQRRSSVRKELSESALGGTSETPTEAISSAANIDATASATESPRPANGRVEQIKEQAGASDPPPAAAAAAARPGTAASTRSVAPSMETAGFATPTGTQSQDGDHAQTIQNTLARPEQPATPTGLAQESTHDSSSTVIAPTSPPRPPKNGQRPPSRQNSQEPIRSGLAKSSSTTLARSEAAQSGGNDLVEKAAQAAPALQNVVPGTGAATRPDA
ncbi:hypothetical protein PHBOTO_005949 [Pseudozyma hubeiensis]|nr:hypothetical protein PHBOTO_005949 [Pseudozyma hubeiensis]